MKSLSQPGMRDSLIAFHKKWYSSNIMVLTVSSKHSLTDLEKWATEKFSPVVNKEVVIPDLGSPAPFPAETQSKLIKFVPVKDEDKLTLFWQLPYVHGDHESKPMTYLSHLIGHEGENSLLSYLISEGLALELSAGDDHELWCISTMMVDILLSKKGLENYEKVIEAVFHYFHKLQELGPQRYVYDECNDIGTMQFAFADKGNALSTCVDLSSKTQRFDDSNMKNILRSRYIEDKFDEEKIKMLVDKMCDPSNMLIFLRS